MIQPIRPVGCSFMSAPGALFGLCGRREWRGCLTQAIWLPWIRLPLALRVYLAQTSVLGAAVALGGDARGLPPGELPAVEPWRPWPARGPFAQEITRWWPSEDWPPVEPPIVLEDRVPDSPPPVIDWRARGSLLDFWV